VASRLILDTDIGTDIDDAYALALVLASPELELVGVTVANNRTDQRAALALKLLHEVGRDDVPVAPGRPTTTGGEVNQYPWAEGYAATRPVTQPAAEFLVEQVSAAPGELTIVAVGPLTNLADALALDPGFARKVAGVVIMGGCVGWPGGATPEIRPEYNIVTDIAAAQALFACGAPLTMVPLDATMRVVLEEGFRQRLANHGSPLTAALGGMLALWPGRTPILHDPLAVGMVLDPTLCGVADLCVAVDDDGYTRPGDGMPNARVAVTPQAGRFLHLFMERLLGQDLRGPQGGLS
jgi:purine nucleosidase